MRRGRGGAGGVGSGGGRRMWWMWWRVVGTVLEGSSSGFWGKLEEAGSGEDIENDVIVSTNNYTK